MARNKRGRRQPHSVERRLGNRPLNRQILIVCGGTVTEKQYFDGLRGKLGLKAVTITVVGKPLDSLSVVEFAIKKRNQENPDEVWCVLDVESPHTNPTFGPAILKAQAESIKLAVSNPAFEFWYLLHYKNSNRPYYNAYELEQDLTRQLPNYSKNAKVFSALFPHTQAAVERANQVWENHPDKHSSFPNPSTSVFKLVQYLLELAENTP